jgi:hypothetical protein
VSIRLRLVHLHRSPINMSPRQTVCALVIGSALCHVLIFEPRVFRVVTGCSGPSGLKFPHNIIFSMSQASNRPEDVERGLDTGMLVTP